MYELVTNRGDLRSELLEVVRCFFAVPAAAPAVSLTYVKDGDIRLYITAGTCEYMYVYPVREISDAVLYARYDVYVNKHALYRALSAYTGKSLPWGSLTGIRPTRIALRYLAAGTAERDLARKMQDEYLVSAEKAALTVRVLQTQTKPTEDRLTVAAGGRADIDKLVNLYVHIPFCPTRCAYCSFVSQGVEKQGWLMTPYAEALVEEIRRTKQIIAEQGKKIFSVYIGGGTPTVLPPALLRGVLEAAYVEEAEYTCEAGRPDTIDDEKMRIAAACGVNRVSINPQTLHDETLRKIGRRHTTAQFFEAYEVASRYGFVRNVDLIAGLDGESTEDFRGTVEGIAALRPENVTVHTLCTKRGSTDAATARAQNEHTADMVAYATERLSACGYAPYYLYRQKQMAGGLENIGWCRDGFLCVNNVTVMEELLPVYACGAGAISKRIPKEGRIARLANPKDVILYLDGFEERMKKKQLFYLNQFTTAP